MQRATCIFTHACMCSSYAFKVRSLVVHQNIGYCCHAGRLRMQLITANQLKAEERKSRSAFISAHLGVKKKKRTASPIHWIQTGTETKHKKKMCLSSVNSPVLPDAAKQSTSLIFLRNVKESECLHTVQRALPRLPRLVMNPKSPFLDLSVCTDLPLNMSS